MAKRYKLSGMNTKLTQLDYTLLYSSYKHIYWRNGIEMMEDWSIWLSFQHSCTS